MNFDNVMVGEAQRLREALLRLDLERPLPAGASDEDLALVADAFPGLHVPGELLSLLHVVNGMNRFWLFMANDPPLLSARQAVEETASRGAGAADNDMSWCAGWVVFAAEGWDFDAVVAETKPRTRAAIVDLSYGNQNFPVVAPSLTSLVAASADALEHGVHRRQTQAREQPYTDPGLARERTVLLAARAEQYPSDDGLATGDVVTFWQQGWPKAWPPATGPERMEWFPTVPLSKAASSPGAVSVVDVLVTSDIADGVLQVRDETLATEVHIPSALADRRKLAAGARSKLVVAHSPSRSHLHAAIGVDNAPLMTVAGVLVDADAFA